VIEILIAFILGILAGTFTGLAPGIHINLVASFLVSIAPKLEIISPTSAVIFISSMSITHIFIDFIPSIYLGAPEEDSFLTVLPGHEMLKQGSGHEAVIYAIIGAFSGVIVSILISPIFIQIIPAIYSLIYSIIPYVLIFVSFFLIFREDSVLPAIVGFLLAGFLGLATFHLPVKNPLLPLLTGLFGLSTIFLSMKQKTSMPKQLKPRLSDIKLDKKPIIKALLSISFIAPFCSILPGIGSSQATIIATEVSRNERKEFIFMQGCASAIFMVFSFITLYTINKARSGSASAINELLQSISFSSIIVIFVACLLASIVAFFLALKVSKQFSLLVEKVNYSKISLFICIFLFIITIAFSSWIGVVILLTGTCLGIYTSLSNIKKSNLMAALIVPAIIYYLTN